MAGSIHHFHIDPTAPCLSPKSLHNHCLRFLLGQLYNRGEIGKNSYGKIWRVNEVHYGLCENGELPLPPWTGCQSTAGLPPKQL